MRSLSSIFSFKNRDPLTAILLFAVLVVAMETAFGFLPQNKLIKSFQIHRVPPGPTPDLQIMGDSVAQQGIVAEDLARGRTSETNVYNFSIAGTGPEFPYFLLKREISAGKIPKAIIWAPSPHTFASLRIPLLVGAFCDWKEIVEVASSGIRPCDVTYGVLCKLSYTLRHREQIADLVKGRKSEDAPAVKPKVATSTSAKVTSKDKPRFPAEKLHAMYKKPFTVEAFNRYYFEKFLSLAREHHIKVYWVTMPELAVVHDGRTQFNFDRDYYQFVDDVQARFHLEVLQKDFLLFGEEDFKDYTHLNEGGAHRFTGLLRNKLEQKTSSDPSAPADRTN